MDDLLRKLRLPRIRAVYHEWIERASREEISYFDFLHGLLEEELCSREEKRLKNLMRRARFPFNKTLEQFDFRIHPELRRKVFRGYLEETFVREGKSLVLIGAPGLGKTHLSVAIGIRMVQRGYDVRFVTVQSLVNRVLAAETYREKQRVLKPYQKCDLLLMDEFGYLLPEAETGPVLYELISSRYEKKATIITSNKSLTEWGVIIQDTALASALIDRLMHHGDVYYLKGESFRLRGKAMPVEPGKKQPTPDQETAKDGTAAKERMKE